MKLELTINDRQLGMLLSIVEQRASVGSQASVQDIAQAALNRGLRDEHDDSQIAAGLRSPDFDSLAFLARQVS